MFLGAFMATSMLWFFGSEDLSGLLPWATSVLVTVGCGTAAWLYGRTEPVRRSPREVTVARQRAEITRREALVIVTMSWLLGSLFSALPLLLDGMVSHPIDAIFEATSGFTTTGSTILSEIEGNSRPSLWWRSMIQWLGGMGIIVLFVAIFPTSGGGGRRLFQSETPGPEKEQLRPRIRQTGAALWRIYLGFTVALLLLLKLEGMSWFDSACHAFTTMATGGFSTKNASIAGFDSMAIDYTITVFMLFAGVNFGLYYALTRGGGLKSFIDRELGVYLSIFVVATIAVTASILQRHGGDVGAALRYGSFQVAALVTSTGFGTDDFDAYPHFARTVLICLIFIGGMGGSTAGGFKVSRLLIVLSTALQEVRHAVHPRGVFATRVGRRAVAEPVVRAAMGMFVISVVLLAVSTLALGLMGLPLEPAFSASLTCMFNSGPGLAELGPTQNFAGVPDAGKLLLSLLMIVGRLEFFTVLTLLLPGFWKPGGQV